MPDSFFSSSKKRKRPIAGPSKSASKHQSNPSKPGKFGKKGNKTPVKNVKKRTQESDETDEDDDEDIDDLELRAEDVEEGSGEEDENETPAQKRLRLAKVYLDGLKEELGEGEFDAAEIDREIISARLQRDVLEHAGKVHLFIANSLSLATPPTLRLRSHKLPLTAATLSENGHYLFTSSKDGSISKHTLLPSSSTSPSLSPPTKHHQFRKIIVPKPKKSKQKAKSKEPGVGIIREEVQQAQGHTDEVLCLAVSSDGKYLVSGGKDRKIGVWDVESESWIRAFTGHRDIISGITFRKGTHQIYTSSYDRTLKIHDLTTMGYVETLFGHQDPILSIDSLRGETALSCGGRDKSVRYWKIGDETQLVFRGGGKSRLREVLEGGLEDEENEDGGEGGGGRGEKRFIEGSIDCVAMIDEVTFVSGGDSGSISLWNTQKKKPLFTIPVAHGLHTIHSATEGPVSSPRWITSLGALRYSDTIASGSWDGEIRLWKLDEKLRTLSALGCIPAMGFVNSLQLISVPGSYIDEAAWARSSSPPSTADDTVDANGTAVPIGKAKKADSVVLLSAALGQEPRLGRWMRMSGEEGVRNVALVVALHCS
ncbi:WD40 repeat-like protein [Sistotremastrum suecicum HHB10207 ss-3]|uniref:WD40 repeat-like protein n=1 Tax=Sistotremastrum suecicum HHB10207 ss-3 TaxID=1314776 RepID=A0A165ZA39_9AGAM|nr:WD40 repeat-like protein [Sistotremastrum suecicum HHB10207 ss-3]